MDDDGCVMGVMDKIKAAIDKIPVEIKAEVTKAMEGVELVEGEVQECADSGLAGFVNNATDIMGVVTDCVNKIIS